MRTQAEKAAAFRALHDRPGAFIIPNPWEAGTAKLLAGLGFEALATTSLGLANMLGCADSKVTRAEVIANCRVIAEATDLPVNADLENCFAHEPEAASETIRLAAEAGTLAARSRTTPAIPPIRSTISILPSRVCVKRCGSRMPCRCRSCLRRVRRTLFTGAPIWLIPFAACKLTKRLALTCFMRRDCVASTRCARSWVREPPGQRGHRLARSRHYAGAAWRGWRQANQRRRRAVPPCSGNFRQRGPGHAAAWLFRLDARHDQRCGTREIVQNLS